MCKGHLGPKSACSRGLSNVTKSPQRRVCVALATTALTDPCFGSTSTEEHFDPNDGELKVWSVELSRRSVDLSKPEELVANKDVCNQLRTNSFQP